MSTIRARAENYLRMLKGYPVTVLSASDRESIAIIEGLLNENKASIPIKDILKEADQCIVNHKSWAASENYDNAFQYQQQAEALIAIVEVFNCGSVGGYDKGQDVNGVRQTLRSRLKWLKDKLKENKS
jgi:hypothetical protein